MKSVAALAELGSQRVALVVGLGLIGRAVAARLARCKALKLINSSDDGPFWSEPEHLLELIEQELSKYESPEVELVWCAGKAGFASTVGETGSELTFFSNCMSALQSTLGARLSVNFISSAGALYKHEDRDLTPYGELKLGQEQCIAKLGIRRRIYRVGTVFDAPAAGVRLGLIAKMIQDAQLGLPTTLYANANTRRDFLLVDDVAREVVRTVLANADTGHRLLVSGRALSLHALVLMLEKILKRKVKVNFMTRTHNDMDLMFKLSELPAGFKVTSLEEGLRLVVNRSQTSRPQPVRTTSAA